MSSNYGKIDLLWLDEDWGRTPEQLRAEPLAELIDRLQPWIVVNDRFGHRYLGHYGTPEQYVPTRVGAMGGPFEVCDTIVESPHWQHVEGERKYKERDDVLRFFFDVLTVGGNYLINIGPRPDGSIPAPEAETLRHLGRFAAQNGAAIYRTEPGLDRRLFGGGSTIREAGGASTLYLFATDRPRPPRHEIAVRGMENPIRGITRVDTGDLRPWRTSGGRSEHGRAGYVWIDASADAAEEGPVVYAMELEGGRVRGAER